MTPVLLNIFTTLGNNLYKALIVEDRYKLILKGLGNTLLIAACATLIGIVIGLLVAIVKYFANGNKKLWLAEKICNIYITVIRGTPMVVQLLIMYTVVFANMRDGVPVAIIAFGVNSGAYLAEIVRAGIFAVDKGQTEAGRSLGLNRLDTMRYIVMPQAIKNILPAMGNEFIVLLKETSVAGYVAIHDLTKAADIIRTNSYNSTALFVVAGIYLVLVLGMYQVLSHFERRLAKRDNR